jgi:hypothetical protein
MIREGLQARMQPACYLIIVMTNRNNTFEIISGLYRVEDQKEKDVNAGTHLPINMELILLFYAGSRSRSPASCCHSRSLSVEYPVLRTVSVVPLYPSQQKEAKMLFSPPHYRSRPVVPVRFTVVVTYVPSIITFGREKRSGVRSLSGGKTEHLAPRHCRSVVNY